MTFSDPDVIRELLKDFVTVKINISNDPETAGTFGVMGVPDVRILDSKGEELSRQAGFIPPPAMMKKIHEARSIGRSA